MFFLSSGLIRDNFKSAHIPLTEKLISTSESGPCLKDMTLKTNYCKSHLKITTYKVLIVWKSSDGEKKKI